MTKPGRHPTGATPYETGFGKPPKQHQFRPGESGNRRGRPKGAKGTAAVLRELMDRKLPFRVGNGVRKMRVLEAILTRITEAGLKGDTKAAAFLLQRYDSSDADADGTADGTPTQEEQEIIESFMQAYLKKGGPT